jgi:hypothetical protein
MKVKIFVGNELGTLEGQINDWLQKERITQIHHVTHANSGRIERGHRVLWIAKIWHQVCAGGNSLNVRVLRDRSGCCPSNAVGSDYFFACSSYSSDFRD